MNYAFPVIAPPTIEKDLFEAMASRMELEIPGDLSISYSERRRLERRIAHDFVLSHVSEKAAFELMDMYRTRQIELNSYHSWSLWNLDRFEYTWFLIRAFGTLAITLLALSISFLATEVPYAISGRGKFMDTKSSRGISFWIAALIAAVVSSLLIYRACDSTLHVVGLRAIPEEPELSNVAFGTIYLTSIVIVVLVLRHFVPHRDRRAFLVLQVAPLLMYLATVCVTELLRDALVNRTVSYYATLHGDSAESPGSPS